MDRMQCWLAAPLNPLWGSKRRVIRQQRSPALPEGSQALVYGVEAGAILGTIISARSSKNEYLYSSLTLPTQGAVRLNPRPDRPYM